MNKNASKIDLAADSAACSHSSPDLARLPISDVFERLNTAATGLSEEEAASRLRRHGPNSICVQKKSSFFSLIRENFLHTMAVLLWIAGILAYIAEMPDLAIAIWLVNIINGAFSLWQEFRAEKATEALKSLLPPRVKVVRNDAVQLIQSTGLVPGDIIVLEEGDQVPADARIAEASSLEVDQSTLTGESHSIKKRAEEITPSAIHGNLLRAEMQNLIFAGTSIISGHARAIVYATGTSTQFGRIAHLTQTIAEQPSPLQREMSRVSKIITLLALGIGAAMYVLATSLSLSTPGQAFVFSMGMIVAFVPEGMVPTITLALALAVQRMAKRNALVKRLSSVEALGCTNVICTDKTGTLTENDMRVVRIFANLEDFNLASTEGSFPLEEQIASKIPSTCDLLRAAVLCNNATFEKTADSFRESGDSTETALLRAANQLGVSSSAESILYPRMHENAFDSQRKRMSTVHAAKSTAGEVTTLTAFIKGSPAIILELCSDFAQGSQRIPLCDTTRNIIHNQINAYAREGLRVIAVAKKCPISSERLAPKEIEMDLCFLGLFAMFDPPRREVAAAVRKCREAGIQIVMITGDYEVTAESIARKVGIVEGPDANVLTGLQLDHMSDQELVEMMSEQMIFARVTPEHKLRIVKAFQCCGKIVAVTGDGVNDAPALKKADIGVAMGKEGTDVAREAADMILLDDNFASIVNAIEEGRTVYDNIKKFSIYVFNSNMAEAVPFMVMLFSIGLIPLPLTMMQVLAIDLGTDMLPAIGLGADHTEDGVMARAPRSLSKPLLSMDLLMRALLWYGGIESIAGMSGYFFLNSLHGWPQAPLAVSGTLVWKQATTMTMACIVASQIGAVFCCRTQIESIFSQSLFDNKLIVYGVITEIALLATLIYFPPCHQIFSTAPLGQQELLFVFLCTPTIVLLDELRKLLQRNLATIHQPSNDK